MALPFPDPRTTEAAHFFDAAAQDRLELQRCERCATVWFYPRPACVACGAQTYSWFTASGRGRVHSYSIVHRAPTPAFGDRVPYVVALIDLDEGPRMMTNVVGGDARAVAIGDAVEVVFEDRGEGRKLPQFRRCAEA